MTLRLISRAALGAMLSLMLQVGSVNAQSGSPKEKSYRVVSQETYNRVLDMLFPRDDPDPSKTVFAFVLRFKPSSKAESQILIRRSLEKTEVIEYTPLNGSIYGKLNETLARGGREDAVEMAKLIRVRRREITVTSTHIKRWYANFFDALDSTTKVLRERGEEFDKTGGSESILLDGATYELWYENRLNKMSFNLYDIEGDIPSSDEEFKLVQWMNAVRREVGRLK